MSYRVELFDPARHRVQLFGLWAGSMENQRIASVAEQRYEWLYERNPSGAARTCVIAHVESGEIVGCASMIPRRISIQGRDEETGLLCDFAVDRRYRTAGPALAVQRRIAEECSSAGVPFLFGYPNVDAAPIFKRLRYTFVGEAEIWVKPLHSEYKVREKVSNPVLVTAASAVVDVGLRARDVATFLRNPSLFRTEIVSRADERFDSLWERERPPYITGAKSSLFLNWRYGQFPTASYEYFTVLKGGELIGYVIYTIENDTVVVAEMLCNLSRDLDVLLFAFSDKMRKLGHKSIYVSYAGTPVLTESLAANHFIKRPHSRQLLTYTDGSLPPEQITYRYDIANWFLFDGELDI